MNLKTCNKDITMQVTVNINNCKECKHLGHSGNFTPGGAEAVCFHPKAVPSNRENRHSQYKQNIIDRLELAQFKTQKGGFYSDVAEGLDEKHHWIHRVVENTEDPPSWCPLRRGEPYN